MTDWWKLSLMGKEMIEAAILANNNDDVLNGRDWSRSRGGIDSFRFARRSSFHVEPGQSARRNRGPCRRGSDWKCGVPLIVPKTNEKNVANTFQFG
jgi:hypothetical protein